ncbi:hypothetical protein ACFUN8_05800 [Streptomyces sp. NPDC057307]|uniref:hypothetical protein n=1 Tax=Streptomyces sp. NPDC057307 TaxID=3346096 RepID=UPI00363A88FE
MDAAEADGGGVGAQLLKGLSEAFGVEPGGFAVGARLVDTPASIGDDQGDERTGPGNYPEGELHQIDELCL